jgi:putative flippase GtrA
MNHSLFILQDYLKQTSLFIRFLMVGVVNTVIGLTTIFILLDNTSNYWLSTFVGNSIGALISFLLNRNFTFHSNVPIHRGAPAFIIVILLSYITSYSVSKWLMAMNSTGIYFIIFTQQDVAVLVGTLLYTFTNYFGQKYFVFAKS